MKRIVLAAGIIMSLTLSQVASATTMTYTFGDTATHWGDLTKPAEDLLDEMGNPQISGGVLNVTDGNLADVTIYATNLSADNHAGDLFINIINGQNDTYWDYIVSSHPLFGAANVAVYDVSAAELSTVDASNPLYIMSSWPIAGGNFRDGQPIGVDVSPLPEGFMFMGEAAFSGLLNTGTSYNFSELLDAIEVNGDILLGWTVLCGNDVLYETVPVPEPGTMMLLGAGLLGLAICGKRRMNKNG